MAAENEPAANPPTVEDAAAQTAATAGHGGTTAVTAQESAGLPQFQFQHWAGQIGYLLILFALLYILMSRVFGPRIRRVFDERRATIEGALSSARMVQAEAAGQADAARQGLAEAQGRAQRTAAEAKAKAAAESAQRNAEVETGLNAKLAEAETRIRASRDKALGEVRGIAAETAEVIVEKLTGTKPQSGAVAAALNQVQG